MIESIVNNAVWKFIFTVIIPLIFTTIIPNNWFYKAGKGIGIALDRTLNKVTGGLWEYIEDHIIGAIVSLVTGISDGSNINDPQSKNVWKKNGNKN